MAASPLYSLRLIATFFFISLNVQANSSQVNISQKVTVERASSLLFYPEKKATALIKPINHAQVPSQISAQVSSINVQIGNSVIKGQILVNLDCQDKTIRLAKQQSQYIVSKAKLSLAKRNFDRTVKLKENRHIGEAELDSSEVEVTVAKENVSQMAQEIKSANLAVERCQVLSPFDGVVTERMVSEGDYVNVGQSLIKVLDQKNIEVEAQIPLEQLKQFRQAAQYYFISNGKKNAISVKNVVNFINSNSRSQIVTFYIGTINSVENEIDSGQSFKDPNQNILVGMNGMVSWQSKRSFFPSHLLTQRKGRYGIFVTQETKGLITAKFIELPQAQEGRPFELTLDKNQQIIVDGRHRVNEGSFVQINKSDK
jgi:RND family efflux transporter MFP subunit